MVPNIFNLDNREPVENGVIDNVAVENHKNIVDAVEPSVSKNETYHCLD